MDSALVLHRLHFAFTVTYHYLFPQLTMGLALLIVIQKTIALRAGDERYDAAAQFWARIFGINFAIGVVTGIPMEFQFGTNWAGFAQSAGNVIGQTLAMEGMFSFFLESSFLALFLYGAKRLSPRMHWLSAVLVWLGSWLSGYFIIVTDAWMQHPVGHTVGPDGTIMLQSLGTMMTNPWAMWQYLHNMIGATLTACFVMASIGAYYLLQNRDVNYAKVFVRTGVVAGFIGSMLIVMPTGDQQGKNVALNQPVTLAAMEGLFVTQEGAPLALVGQPDMAKLRLDNPLEIPRVLSFLTYERWGARVQGLDQFPQDEWPDNIPLLYYAYHIMVGLGTIFGGVMAGAAFLLWRGWLFDFKPALWVLMLMLPFPYIANTAGWMTAELGRQPWLIYGLMRTADGSSANVSTGSAMFTLLGFMGLYALLSVLFLFLVAREIHRGPDPYKAEVH